MPESPGTESNQLPAVTSRVDRLDPSPIERYEIVHPAVPESLDGLRVLHIADQHVRRKRGEHSVLARTLEAVSRVEVDIAVITGDLMGDPGTEGLALEWLKELVSCWRVRLGAFGVFGNHDTREMIRAVGAIDQICWLDNESASLETDGGRIRIVGASDPEDLLGARLGDGGDEPALTLGLVHYPSEIVAGSTLEIPIIFAGHTHGGQVRLTPGISPHTSSDMPSHLAAGVLRLGQTLCCVSRGLGEALVEVRVNCKPHAPLYVLRRGELPAGDEDRVVRVLAW